MSSNTKPKRQVEELGILEHMKAIHDLPFEIAISVELYDEKIDDLRAFRSIICDATGQRMLVEVLE